ncbi:MAG: hypothetical protein EAZ99_14570 [Alphaproteobacteria bacterium]|nr:MAG: hypothetical protein EAZ99_14570 [Alphaproteobacteria bacterium]
MIELRALAARLDLALHHWPSERLAAIELAVNRQTLRRYRAAEAEPGALFVARVAELSGVSLHWLMTGEGPQRGPVVAEPAVLLELHAGMANAPDPAAAALKAYEQIMASAASPSEIPALVRFAIKQAQAG